MPIQSINLSTSATTVTKFNGSDVTKINLNGTEIWAKPSSCVPISNPYVESIPSLLLHPSPPAWTPVLSVVALHTFNVSGIQCANRYRFELPAYNVFLYVSFIVNVNIEFYAGNTLIHTSPSFDGTMSNYSAAIDHTGTIPTGTTKFVVRLTNSNSNYGTCSSYMRPGGSLKLWGE